MSLREKILSEGMRLAANPNVAKVMQDERVMRFVMTAASMPGRLSSYTNEQKEAFAKAMGLATADEVRDLKRTVTALEQTVAKLRAKPQG